MAGEVGENHAHPNPVQSSHPWWQGNLFTARYRSRNFNRKGLFARQMARYCGKTQGVLKGRECAARRQKVARWGARYAPRRTNEIRNTSSLIGRLVQKGNSHNAFMVNNGLVERGNSSNTTGPERNQPWGERRVQALRFHLFS